MGFDDPFWNPLSGEQRGAAVQGAERTAFSKPRIVPAVTCSGPPDVPLRVVPAVLRCGRDRHGRAWWKLVCTAFTLVLHTIPTCRCSLQFCFLLPGALLPPVRRLLSGWCVAGSGPASSAFVVVHTNSTFYLLSLSLVLQPMTASACRSCTP